MHGALNWKKNLKLSSSQLDDLTGLKLDWILQHYKNPIEN